MANSSFIPEECCPFQKEKSRTTCHKTICSPASFSFPAWSQFQPPCLLPPWPWLLRVSLEKREKKSPQGWQFLARIMRVRKRLCPVHSQRLQESQLTVPFPTFQPTCPRQACSVMHGSKGRWRGPSSICPVQGTAFSPSGVICRHFPKQMEGREGFFLRDRGTH